MSGFPATAAECELSRDLAAPEYGVTSNRFRDAIPGVGGPIFLSDDDGHVWTPEGYADVLDERNWRAWSP